MQGPGIATMAATRQSFTRPFRAARQAAPFDIDLSGHDYMENNLRFTLDREPDNSGAR
jgi:hypothetical protein